MSKKRIKYIHIFIWLFAIFANLANFNFSGDMSLQHIVSYIFAFLYLMVVFYLFYSFLAPFFLDRNKITTFFAISFLIVLIMPFFGYTVLYFIKAVFDDNFKEFYKGYSVHMHMSGYFPVLTAAIFGSFFRVIINWYVTLNQKSELDKQKMAVELDLLKSKLSPHFLFNTLNNIDSLIHQNSEEASAALIRLSDMMRYLTYETSSDMVELSREVEYLRNYIELQRIRIKSPEDIRFEVEGDQSAMLSPALFVPLIENAFKFASFRSKKPCIDIKILSKNGIVDFDATNYYENRLNFARPAHSGYGLINLRKRLDLTYPGNYQLITESAHLLYHVKLIIKTNAN
jgi:two-component system, LytTR family, sensor kinase